jgi:hypothetical protein
MLTIMGTLGRVDTGRLVPIGATLGVAIAALAAGLGGGTVAAQGQGPCALLTHEEVQALAPVSTEIGEGVSAAVPAGDFSMCRYTWGAGVERYTLVVAVGSASRMFAGKAGDAIKQDLLTSIVPGTTDEAVPEVGDVAVFKAPSSVFAGASAFLKGRVVQVRLDGIDARDRKGELISLLKSAASRL